MTMTVAMMAVDLVESTVGAKAAWLVDDLALITAGRMVVLMVVLMVAQTVGTRAD
jgi:hypothetical protein